jgi:hypothetical protein
MGLLGISGAERHLMARRGEGLTEKRATTPDPTMAICMAT